MPIRRDELWGDVPLRNNSNPVVVDESLQLDSLVACMSILYRTAISHSKFNGSFLFFFFRSVVDSMPYERDIDYPIGDLIERPSHTE